MLKQITRYGIFMICGIVIIICLLSACVTPVTSIQKQTPQQQEEKYIRFQCPGQYIQFEYPETWNFTSGCTNDWGGDYSIKNPANNSEINIFIRGPVVIGVIQIEKWSDYQYNISYDSLTREYGKKITINKTRLDDMPAIEFYLYESFPIEDDGFIRKWEKTTINHYRRYSVLYITMSKKFDADYPVAKHVMNSFTFIEPDKSKTTSGGNA